MILNFSTLFICITFILFYDIRNCYQYEKKEHTQRGECYWNGIKCFDGYGKSEIFKYKKRDVDCEYMKHE